MRKLIMLVVLSGQVSSPTANAQDALDRLVQALNDRDDARVVELFRSGVVTIRKYGGIALDSAATRNNLELLGFLLDNGVSADGDGKDLAGQTPLMLAAARGHVGILKELLRRGAKTTRKSADGMTALMVAAHWCQPEAVRTLLEAGSDAKALDRFGRSPLAFSAMHGCLPVVDTFVSRGVSLETKDKVGRTPLMLAAGGLTDSEMREWGFNRGMLAFANGESDDLVSGLLGKNTFSAGLEATVALLLAKGASVAAKDRDGHTALALALSNGRVNIAKLLRDAGAR